MRFLRANRRSQVSTRQELLDKVLHEHPRPPRELVSDIPPPLEVACLRALSKNPADRVSSAIELAQTVERWQETQRRVAEEALRASESLYHSLVETIPMNVWRKDVDGRFTFANQGFCRATGRRLDECLGKTDFDLFPPEAAEKYRADDARVMATGETLDATEKHITADGKELYVRFIKLPIHDVAGRVVGTQGIWWGETEVKRLEKVLVETQTELAMLKQRLRDAERANDIGQSPSI